MWLQIEEKQKQLSAARKQLKGAKAEHKASHDDRSKKCESLHRHRHTQALSLCLASTRQGLNVWCLLYGTHLLTLCFIHISVRAVEAKRKAVQRIEEQLMKLQVQATDREENKQIALGTSKLNYLDPRISVAWYLCDPWKTLQTSYYNDVK